MKIYTKFFLIITCLFINSLVNATANVTTAEINTAINELKNKLKDTTLNALKENTENMYITGTAAGRITVCVADLCSKGRLAQSPDIKYDATKCLLVCKFEGHPKAYDALVKQAIKSGL